MTNIEEFPEIYFEVEYSISPGNWDLWRQQFSTPADAWDYVEFLQEINEANRDNEFRVVRVDRTPVPKTEEK